MSLEIRTDGRVGFLAWAVVLLALAYAVRLDYLLWSALLRMFSDLAGVSWMPDQTNAPRPRIVDLLDAIIGATAAGMCCTFAYALNRIAFRRPTTRVVVAASVIWSLSVGVTYLWPMGIVRSSWLSCWMAITWALVPRDGHHPTDLLLRVRFALGMSQVTIGGGVAVLTIVFLRGLSKYFDRNYDHLCPTCHYDLTGNVSGRCPECGHSTGKAGTSRMEFRGKPENRDGKPGQYPL
jgi:hypothetical protein